MLIKKKDSSHLSYSEVTPKEIAFNRRKFLTGAAAAGVGALAGGAFYRMTGPEERVMAGAKLRTLIKSIICNVEERPSGLVHFSGPPARPPGNSILTA